MNTKETLAAHLNGREYGGEITDDEERQAKSDGLIVLFGYSDDNAEFRGAISDEVGCFGGRTLRIHRGGALRSHDSHCECEYCGYRAIANRSVSIEAIWNKDGYSWTYKTDIPHATFDIMEDGEKYCRGIVFELASLPEVRG